mmetsp:Transcript_43918/g.86679  ORF Transcript_43918/g.86679 Transcript_43918/m.86679 type:complete len:206 (-) Transcript_43918:337-954(-)
MECTLFLPPCTCPATLKVKHNNPVPPNSPPTRTTKRLPPVAPPHTHSSTSPPHHASPLLLLHLLHPSPSPPLRQWRQPPRCLLGGPRAPQQQGPRQLLYQRLEPVIRVRLERRVPQVDRCSLDLHVCSWDAFGCAFKDSLGWVQKSGHSREGSSGGVCRLIRLFSDPLNLNIAVTCDSGAGAEMQEKRKAGHKSLALVFRVCMPV